jgi:hypothetical protein
MREAVQAILEREIARLDATSRGEGLDLDDCRRLDLLIKAYKSFAAPENSPPGRSGPGGDTTPPASMPTDDLLSALQNSSGGARG